MRHEGGRRDRCSRSALRMLAAAEMEVGPPEPPLQGEAPNHRELRRSKAEVVSVGSMAVSF